MEGLKEISIGTLAKGIRGVSYKPTQLKDDIGESDYFLLRSNNIQNGKIDFNDRQIVVSDCVSEKQKLLDGDIIVCMSNGSRHLVGKSAIVKNLDANYCVGAFCSSFRVNEGVNPNFVFQVFQSKDFKNKIDVILSGSAINNLQNKHIEELNFELPSSKPEQTRIAQILSKADTAIAQTEALIAKYQHIKTGLMQDLLTKGIDEHGNIRSEQTHRFKTENGLRVPEEWEVKTTKDFARITTGSSDTQDKDEAGIYPFFVRSQTIELSNRFIFEGEGVLTSGDGVGVGKIYHYINGKFDFHQRVYLIYEFEKEYILGKYFFYYFRENFYIEVSKYSAKTTVDSVRMKMIADMLIPVPKISEQMKIVNVLDKIESFIERESIELNKHKSLKTGLMQDLLLGKVRVTVKEETLVNP